MVSASGRGNYEVTKSGIEWVLANAESLESYARHIRRDIIQQVSVWAAIAAENLKTGEEVGVYMKDGFLYAGKTPLAAMGTVVADAKKGEDVGVARLNGIIEHHEGIIHVCKVPRIQHGGSRKVQTGPAPEDHRRGRAGRGCRARGMDRPERRGEKTRPVLWCPGRGHRGGVPRDRLCHRDRGRGVHRLLKTAGERGARSTSSMT